MLDTDSSTNDHTQFREYSNLQGRWLSPDPYSGSYDFNNPQSFNRYTYVLNNPLGTTDSSGLCGDDPFCGGNSLIPWPIQFLECWFGFTCGEHFTASLKPRPNATGDPNWDGNFGESLGISTKIPQGNWGVASALGLPGPGCEFGSCGNGGISGFQNGNGTNPGSVDVLGTFGAILVGVPRWLLTGYVNPPSARCLSEASAFKAKFVAVQQKQQVMANNIWSAGAALSALKEPLAGFYLGY